MTENPTSSPPRPTSSRDEVEGLNSSSSLVPGVYTGTRTKSDQGLGRTATSSPAGPEHFAAIAGRHFIRLREITMLDPTSPIAANFTTLDRDDPTDRPPLPSAEDHYRDACRLLGEAHGAGYNLGERRALIEAVEQHIRAGELALRIWPAKLAELQAVADAARELQVSTPDEEMANEAKLAEALRKLDAA